MNEMNRKRYEKNQILRVQITDIGENGEGIGKVDGYTLFVKDAVVGDEVDALITKPKKNYAYARTHKVVVPSTDRVVPPCENASRCGGCQIQNLSYDAQKKYKEKKVRDDLIRIGGFDESIIDTIMEPIVGCDNPDYPFRYRNKAQFPIGRDKNGNIIAGFYAGRTHSIIACEDCLIGVEENKDILNIIISYMEENHITAYDETSLKGIVRHVLIRKGFSSGEIMVCLVISSAGKITGFKSDSGVEYSRISTLPNQNELIEKLKSIDGVKSICVSVNPENTNVIMGNEIHLLWGKGVISDTMRLRDVQNDFSVIDGTEVKFDISPLSFYQVNPVQVEKLYSIALDYARLSGTEEVWDICCGIGTISLCAARYMEKEIASGTMSDDAKRGIVHGIEIVPPAIEDAKKNAENNGIQNVEFICAAAEEYLPEHKEEIRADVIILDPPRKGMETAALDVIADTSPSRIVYVSCDPATLSRDLKYLCEKGYLLCRVRPVDMFMHSVHVETVVLLSKKKATDFVEIGVDTEDYYRIKDK